MTSQTPPERIHGWLNSHLSIARFYGGIDLHGHRYVIAKNEPGQPLVRQDVLQAEAKAAKKANTAKQKQERAEAMRAQLPLVERSDT